MESKEKELLERIEFLENQIDKLKNHKKYGLIWDAEKEPEKIVLDCKRKLPILKEIRDKFIMDKNTKFINLLIEGDNYHSLSVLNYTHRGKIDIIYIDPPYNTGNKNEWKYNDHWVNGEDSWKHSKWLSFMEKRLRLSKSLLKENGFIAISIDDNELAQLKLLCNDIFGEENFLAHINRIQSRGSKNDSKYFISDNDYILIYAKNKEKVSINKIKVNTELSKYNKQDKIGNYKRRGLEMGGGGEDVLKYRPKMGYSIYYHPDKKDYKILFDYDLNLKEVYKEPDRQLISKGYICVRPKKVKGEFGRWRWGSEKFLGSLNDVEIDTKNLRAYTKEREKDITSTSPTCNIQFLNTLGTNILGEILGTKNFNFPKPVELIKYILDRNENKHAVILDFFAGSGTTGHAVMELNNEDGGNRKFILCTNNEDNNGEGSKIAADICYPRLKRVIKGYKNNKNNLVSGLGGSLAYFKTEFIDVENVQNVSDKKKIDLTYQAGELIAIKEDSLQEIEKNEWWQIFKSPNKKVAIYFREDQSKLEDLLKKLKNDKSVLYLFSWGKNEMKGEDLGYENVKIKDIPQPIIEVYKEINKI